MTQRELNRAVAAVTGESVGTIERMGFGPLEGAIDEHMPQILDWDETDDISLDLLWAHRSEPTAFT